MAKNLTFVLDGKNYELEPIKLDRKKLYGWSEMLVTDSTSGEECEAIGFHPASSTFIGKGSSALGSINTIEEWVEKSDLKAVCLDGKEAALIPSSFDAHVVLDNTISIEEYLDHAITAVYSLQGEENCPEFVKQIKESSAIYTFVFNYRADYEGSAAFVIENGGELFVLVGDKLEFEYKSIEQNAVLDDEETTEEADDSLDFSMM